MLNSTKIKTFLSTSKNVDNKDYYLTNPKEIGIESRQKDAEQAAILRSKGCPVLV